MPCTVKKTVEIIRDKHANYCIGLKGNQKVLYNQALQTSRTQVAVSAFESAAHQRGREEHRCVRVFDAPESCKSEWMGLERFIEVERSGYRQGLAYKETLFYIVSLQADAKVYANFICGHWQIENNLHYAKDVFLSENACKARSGHTLKNLSLIRSIVINLLRKHNFPSLLSAQRKLANKIHALFALLL